MPCGVALVEDVLNHCALLPTEREGPCFRKEPRGKEEAVSETTDGGQSPRKKRKRRKKKKNSLSLNFGKSFPLNFGKGLPKSSTRKRRKVRELPDDLPDSEDLFPGLHALIEELEAEQGEHDKTDPEQ
jgi:hypothetical protein